MPTEWTTPQRPAEYAEQALIEAILDHTYPPGSTLPGERDLATQLGVTRPTLREALQRMARDGWINIQQGKATEVLDVWTEGGLNILNSLAHYSDPLQASTNGSIPFDFVPALLDVRCVMAPAYTRAALEQGDTAALETHLAAHPDLAPDPHAYTRFDWGLHHALTIASGNPIYTLILNGFEALYREMGPIYFGQPAARDASQRFYTDILAALRANDPAAAQSATRQAMAQSREHWQQATHNH